MDKRCGSLFPEHVWDRQEANVLHLAFPQYKHELHDNSFKKNASLTVASCFLRYDKAALVCEHLSLRSQNQSYRPVKIVPSPERGRASILVSTEVQSKLTTKPPDSVTNSLKKTVIPSRLDTKDLETTTASSVTGASLSDTTLSSAQTSALSQERPAPSDHTLVSSLFSKPKTQLSTHASLSAQETADSSKQAVVSSGYATISVEDGSRESSALAPASSVEVVACPKGHFTHAFLACDADSACWAASGLARCVAPLTPMPPMFACQNGVDAVPYSLLCDFRADCRDASDEEFCDVPPCTASGLLSCGGLGQCFLPKAKCDRTQDCVDGTDESCCSGGIKMSVYPRAGPPARIVFNDDGTFHAVALQSSQCPAGHFQCPGNGFCMPVFLRCNGVNDCPGMEDEMACDTYTCPGFYRCRGARFCLELVSLCDGEKHCPQFDDELLCDLRCPANCTCRGLGFFCGGPFPAGDHPTLRFLEARGSGLSLREVASNTDLVHLGLAACGIPELSDILLTRLHSVDLSDNLLRTVSLRHFQWLRNLRELLLAGNPLVSVTTSDPFSSLREFRPLRTLDLSRTFVKLFYEEFIDELTELTVLNVSHSGLTTMQGLDRLHGLRRLDLRGCKVADFPPRILQNMADLAWLYADNPKLCCQAVLPEDFNTNQCFAPVDEISSCEALLRSNFYRVVLTVCSVLALLGNLVSFIYRVRLPASAKKLGFNVFVTQLCLSDFLMGVYLAVIGVADRVYLGSYLWKDVAWKRSAVCKVAGFMSLLSSETSAFVVCLITLERFVVLRFPFSRLRFRGRSAYLASSVVWGLGLLLAALPLLPASRHWAFYSQTGICIPLPVTRADFPGHGYSFGVMIVCNLVLFLLIAVGQALIYWSVKANSMSPLTLDTPTSKTSDAAIARRLLTIVMSDFLCWFPIGLCGVMSSKGYPIPGEVNVAMAILVLPLNSALNPFLYTLNIILEKREKRQEERIKKFLLSEIKSDRLNRQ